MIRLSISFLISTSSITKGCFLGLKLPPSTTSPSLPPSKIGFLQPKIGSFHENASPKKFLDRKDGILMSRKERMVVVRASQGFGGFSGGGRGNGWDRSSAARVLGSLALVLGLASLSMTGQLGWVLDAIVSLWLLAVLVLIVGLGAFFWVAGQDIVQSSCPNCGNDFQIFKSSMEDGPQLCPFCSQPFSVQGDKFVREATWFSSNRPRRFGQVFNGFSPHSEKCKSSAATVVDIQAEVRDID